jgi:hypothetical protein
MGTIFESSHLPLHLWLQVIHLFCASKKGISTHQIQRMLRCSMKTAWFLGHRIREAMNEKAGPFFSPLGGDGVTLEGDETYIGPAAKNRAYEAPKPKQAVLALVERDGMVRSFHIPNVTAQVLHTVIGRHAHPDSRFMTDEAPAYTSIGWNFAAHRTVKHADKEYVRREFKQHKEYEDHSERYFYEKVHTNTIEGYFSILKRGIYGVYQHVSEAHLHRYLGEFDFRCSNRVRLGFDDVKRTDIALDGFKGKRLTYETTRSQRSA